MKILFRNLDNSVTILCPTEEVLKFATIMQIAEKDVPHELPYKFINDEDIPETRLFRDAWEWDNDTTPDGFGGEYNEFDKILLDKYYKIEEK